MTLQACQYHLILCSIVGAISCGAGGMLRTGQSASESVRFQSNQNCRYYVDGQYVAAGRNVVVMVSDAPHKIECKPDGFILKTEYVNPPYYEGLTVAFTYFIGEEDQQARSSEPTRWVSPIASSHDESRLGVPADREKAAFTDFYQLADHLAQGIAVHCRQGEIVAVAELPRTDRGCTVGLSARIREATVDALVRRGIAVVERERLDALFTELRFQHGGAVDPQQAVVLGRLAGATALATGGLTDIPDMGVVNVSLRLTDLRTGVVMGSSEGRLTRSSGVVDELSR